jgi:5'-deoxynucleotidase YfbR-like HD superfamily hydrolase
MTIAYELITAADAARVAVEPSAIIRHLLTHDVAEGYLGDTPAHVKAEYGRVSGALHAAEESWNTRNIPEYLTHQLVPYEKDLVKAADTLELGYFCVEEREMGNRAVAPVFNYVVDYVDRQELRKVHGVAPIIDCLTRRWRKFHAVDL